MFHLRLAFLPKPQQFDLSQTRLADTTTSLLRASVARREDGPDVFSSLHVDNERHGTQEPPAENHPKNGSTAVGDTACVADLKVGQGFIWAETRAAARNCVTSSAGLARLASSPSSSSCQLCTTFTKASETFQWQLPRLEDVHQRQSRNKKLVVSSAGRTSQLPDQAGTKSRPR